MKLAWRAYALLFILLYLGYFWWIDIMHSRINALSVTAIALPVILLVVLYQLIRKSANANWATHVVLVICVAMGTGAFYQLWVHERQSHFTMGKWQAEPEERVWMVDDLLTQYDFVGMDALSLESMLGKETDTSYFEAPNRLVYNLGSERGFISIDNEWLVFDVNEKGVVTNVQIMRD